MSQLTAFQIRFMYSSESRIKSVSWGYLTLIVFSIFALGATFLASSSSLGFTEKLSIFAIILVIYLVFTVAFYYWQSYNAGLASSKNYRGVFTETVEEKLLILEEASEFFGASLKSADMFRLVSSRVKELVPFSNCALFLPTEDKLNLKAAYVSGDNSRHLKDLVIKSDESLAGRVFLKGKAEFETNLETNNKSLQTNHVKNLKSAIAVPLKRGVDVFGVLQFYSSANGFNKDSILLLEAIGERIAPLLSSSMAFERSLSGAMTDALTELPNERAFYLVLENQIAEAQRFPEKQQLTVLTMDIADFTELNQKYGHSTGDKILAFAAQTIKTQLRKMDFLARSVKDEFFAVLPTASEEITAEIIKRIERAFVLNSFVVSNQDKIHLKLNFGTATFLKDSEFPNQLVRTALLRKEQDKSEQANKILWFPKEYLN